jgi:hypothetical protein
VWSLDTAGSGGAARRTAHMTGSSTHHHTHLDNAPAPHKIQQAHATANMRQRHSHQLHACCAQGRNTPVDCWPPLLTLCHWHTSRSGQSIMSIMLWRWSWHSVYNAVEVVLATVHCVCRRSLLDSTCWSHSQVSCICRPCQSAAAAPCRTAGPPIACCQQRLGPTWAGEHQYTGCEHVRLLQLAANWTPLPEPNCIGHLRICLSRATPFARQP